MKSIKTISLARREAMAGYAFIIPWIIGCPVLALSIMGTREILEGAAGAVIAQDDVEDFAAKAVKESVKSHHVRLDSASFPAKFSNTA